MKLPLLGGAYGGRSLPVSAERCVNFYPEVHGETVALVGTPGLTLRLTLGTGPVRALHRFGEVMLAVAGATVYRITSDLVATSLGTIGTATGAVSIADNGTSALIVDGSATGYTVTGVTLASVADADFVGGTGATSQDGYLIVTEPNSGRFRISDLNSATSWISSDFSTIENRAGNALVPISDHRELWVLGQHRSVVYANTGDADFPFEQMPAGFIEKGIAAAGTLVKFDNSLAWLSRDDRGQAVLVTAGGGYQPIVISPQAINWQWAQYARVDDAFAFVYQAEGHEFLVLTFPAANRSWVLNATTKQWHQWSSNIDDDPLSRHRSNCHCFFQGRQYVGDYASGKIYSIEPAVYTEDGATIIRDRIGQHVNADEERIFLREIQVTFEEGTGLASGQGSDPQAMLRWSKDGGRTWGNELWRSVGAIGEYSRRAIWRKPGMARNWTFWLRVSDPVKWVVTGAVGSVR